MFTGSHSSTSNTPIVAGLETDTGDPPSGSFSVTSNVTTITHPNHDPPSTHSSALTSELMTPINVCLSHPLFTISQLGVDRRLIVNRKRQLKMYRVWMQGKFIKL